MGWKDIKVDSGSKLFRVHNFTFIHKGQNYLLEVDESGAGQCVGFGEHSTDKNFFIDSVSAKTVDECVEQLVKKICARDP